MSNLLERVEEDRVERVMATDPIRPPETDEEPWLPETAGPEPRRSLLARIRALLRRK